MRRFLVACFAAATVAFGATSAAAEGKLVMVGVFSNGDTEVDVATFTQLDDKGVEQRVGLVGVRQGPRRNSAAFGASEWPAFVRLWHAAEQAHPAAWTVIGQYLETGTDDVSTLRLSSGPSAYRFVIESPAKGALNVEIPRDRTAAFDDAVKKVEAYLGHKS